MTPEDLALVFEAARLSVEHRLMAAEVKDFEARRDVAVARLRKLEEQLAGTEVEAVGEWIVEGGGH
jgi:hypothetical protein